MPSLNSLLKSAYRRLLPYDWRYQLYALRNPQDLKHVRETTFESSKGNFSLTNYDKHQAIFVHITKSAGTSVAKGLFGAMPYHYTAVQFRTIFGRHAFNHYYKFCFVRNPWDRLFSAYSFLKGGDWNQDDADWAKNNPHEFNEFNEFVMNWISKDRLNSHIHFWPQTRFVCDFRGRPLLDDLYYFETIQDDFEQIAKKLGINAQLPHTNASKRASYLDAYSPEAIKKVASLYSSDINNFGYTFDGLVRRSISNGQFVYA